MLSARPALRRHPAPLLFLALGVAMVLGTGSVLQVDRKLDDGSLLRPGGVFHRFEAAWIVKDSGEPLTLSVVVPCQRTLLGYRFEGGVVSTEDPATAPHPGMAAVASRDGGVLVAEVPDLCGPGAMLRAAASRIVPRAVWYPQARRLADPTAAEDQGDYASPSAKIEFLNASAVPVRFADYVAFIAARKGAVPPAATPFGFSEAQVSAGVPALPPRTTAPSSLKIY